MQRAVLKYFGRECRHASQFKQFDEAPDASPESTPGPTEEQVRTHQYLTGTEPTKHEALQAAVDDMLCHIDNADMRTMCRLFIECEGNVSEVARRMKLSEGTIRYRITMLKPKLLAAGFDPFSEGGIE